MAEADDPAEANDSDTPATETDDHVDDDHDWPMLSELDLEICVADPAVRSSMNP